MAPPELEGVLLSHPNIVDAAVIGVPDAVREGGELPRGYVIRRPGSEEPTDKEVHEYMRERLSSFKMLEGGLKWVDAIPKNASVSRDCFSSSSPGMRIETRSRVPAHIVRYRARFSSAYCARRRRRRWVRSCRESSHAQSASSVMLSMVLGVGYYDKSAATCEVGGWSKVFILNVI